MRSVLDLALCCAMAFASAASAGSHVQTKEDALMNHTANGPFDVKLEALQT